MLEATVMGSTHRTRRALFCPMGPLIVSALLSAQGLPSDRPEALGFSTVGLSRIGSVVRAHVDSGLIAGAVVVVARKGTVVSSEAFGVMDLEPQGWLTGPGKRRAADAGREAGLAFAARGCAAAAAKDE